MDNRPIGVFDSGMGGLTAVRELAALLPHEQLIYFGDTGRVPYGGRSRNTIIRYARQDVAFLRSFDLKAIVVACGTVSTTALPILQAEAAGFPIFGVVDPTAQQAVDATRNGKIGLIATRASIRTGAYQAAICQLRPEAQVTALACPLFVPLVENGRTQPDGGGGVSGAAEGGRGGYPGAGMHTLSVIEGGHPELYGGGCDFDRLRRCGGAAAVRVFAGA